MSFSDYAVLSKARLADSKWQPSIFIDIPTPNEISKTVPTCIDLQKEGGKYIVPLMAEPSENHQNTLMQQLKYPKGAS